MKLTQQGEQLQDMLGIWRNKSNPSLSNTSHPDWTVLFLCVHSPKTQQVNKIITKSLNNQTIICNALYLYITIETAANKMAALQTKNKKNKQTRMTKTRFSLVPASIGYRCGKITKKKRISNQFVCKTYYETNNARLQQKVNITRPGKVGLTMEIRNQSWSEVVMEIFYSIN